MSLETYQKKLFLNLLADNFNNLSFLDQFWELRHIPLKSYKYIFGILYNFDDNVWLKLRLENSTRKILTIQQINTNSYEIFAWKGLVYFSHLMKKDVIEYQKRGFENKSHMPAIKCIKIVTRFEVFVLRILAICSDSSIWQFDFQKRIYCLVK